MCRFVEFNRSDIQKLNDKLKNDPRILCAIKAKKQN